MPALPPYNIIEPIWQQFAALLPEREVNKSSWDATAPASPTG